MKFILLLALLAMPALHGQAETKATTANTTTAAAVTVTTENPLDGPFLGFGAEWDSYAYNHYKINSEDYATIRKRLSWMKMPIARTLILARWCYQGGDHYDFESPEMLMLYRQLDLCEELGIQVVLTEWGLNQTWMEVPGVTTVTDPKYAEVIGTYLSHLLNVKKYTCIRQFIFMNEPEWMANNKTLGLTNEQARDTWHQGLKNVIKELDARGLRDRLIVAGPDQSGNHYDWLKYIAQTAPKDVGAYDIHLYANQSRQYPTVREAADSGLIRDYLSDVWHQARHDDPDKKKPLILAEAGFALQAPEFDKSERFSAGNNGLSRDWRYGLYMTQYAIQAVEAGTWSVLAWMLDDSSHTNFTWGMWENKENGSTLKPWFYTWSLLSRSFPANSTFSLLNGLPAGVEGIAAKLPSKNALRPGWSLVLVNTYDTPIPVRVTLPADAAPAMLRYLYAEKDAKVDANGFPLPVEQLAVGPGSTVSVNLPARSVTFLVPAAPAETR